MKRDLEAELKSKIKQGSLTSLKTYLEDDLRTNSIKLEDVRDPLDFRFFQGVQKKLKEVIGLLP